MPFALKSLLFFVALAALGIGITSPLAAQLDARLLDGLSARTLGPAAVSGRITAIDAVATDPNHIVIGAATGGVWLSSNGGLTWTAVFDDQPVASIGAVAINQNNPDIIWVGTGEGNVRNSTSIGGGMFKSIDGGKTWQNIGLEGTERINRIALHPDLPNVAYVAALGTLWGENEDRGIFKTTDGGKTWRKILYVDQKTGGTDVKLDPFNPEKLYASMWQHRRWPYFFESGGPGSGMYVSWDGGENWQQKTEDDGLPAGELGRITFAPSAARKGRVYALVEAKKSAMLRSDDGGQSWAKTNEEYDIAVRPFYYTEVAADPENADRVYNIFTRLSVSIDAGKTFELNPVVDCCAAGNTIHIDNHSLWINPSDSRHLILGNDGGIAISRDRGETWRFVRNLPLSQFYHIRVDNDVPYNIYGGLQDNGSWRGPSEVWENAGIRNLHWQEVGFGDGFDTLPDPENSRRGYVMSQGGFLSTWNLDTGEQRLIRPAPPNPDVDLRFNWSAAIAQDPFEPATIYYGSQFVHKSTDRGASWTTISDDLTSNNPEWQTFRESGGLTRDVTAAENYTTIVSIAPSPLEQGTLWVGTDDGRIHVTRDGGDSWTRIDEGARGAPANGWVPMITASPHDAGTAFVVFDNHRRSDMNTYVFRAQDYGRSWTNLGSEDLSGYALSVLQDPVDPQLLFLGTEFGLFVSVDGGAGWSKFTAGVPTVSVMDMAIQPRENDLVLGTHGRSLYVLDDYSALRGLDNSAFNQRLAILSVTPGQQYTANQTPSTRFTGSGEFRAANEPYGVMITFVASGDDLPHPDEYLERERKSLQRAASSGKDTDDDEDDEDDKNTPPKVEMTVRDAAGSIIRTRKFSVQQGINRIVWDMQRDGVRPMPGPEPAELADGLPGGPEVPAGDYEVTLSLVGEHDEPATSSQPVTVLADPRSPFSAAARESNYQARLEVMGMQEQAVTAVERIAHAQAGVATALELIGQHQQPGAEPDENLKTLTESAKSVQKGLAELEQRFRTPPKTKGIVYDDDKVTSKVGLAGYYIGSTNDAPTATAAIYLEQARVSLDTALESLERFMQQELEPFRRSMSDAGIGLFATSIGE
ncbi:MAG: hypothetical protein OET46_02850 [Xanthomonadales bacterium]|jgi:photosystem II stability/assembly factor-like uncharacterized protein|nr:hypothetical protein [Xanthomonadales bacterium]